MYPPLVVYAAKGPLIRAVCCRDNPSTPPAALLWMVGTDTRRGWVGKSDRGSNLKGAGYVCFTRPLYMFFPAAADLKSVPLDRVVPLAAAVLIAASIELNPPRWICFTSGALVDVERALFHGAASRLPAASSNARVPPLIRLYPPRQKIFQAHRPRLFIMKVFESIPSRKKHRMARAGDLSVEVRIL
jgi:hypothetical protein